MVTFIVEDKPAPPFIVESVHEPDVRWRYSWDERGDPTPEQFERVSYLDVSLAVMLPDLEGEVKEKAEAARQAIAELREAMIDERELDEEQRREISMGNLDALPEVEKDDAE